MKKLGKKAMYMSVSVLVILFALFIIFQSRANVVRGEKDLVTDRAKIIVMDDFMKSFRDYYTYEIMSTAVKPALEKLTESGGNILVSDLENAMNDPEIISLIYTSDHNLGQALSSLSFEPDETSLGYMVDSIIQKRYDSFEITFKVDYSFSFLGNTWSEDEQIVVVPVSVYSLNHPDYTGYGTITEDWVENTGDNTCYIEKIFSAGSLDCDGKNDIKPRDLLPPPETP